MIDVKDLKKKRLTAMRQGDKIAANIFKLIIGEWETETKAGRYEHGDDVTKIVRKLIKSNDEVIPLKEDNQKEIEENNLMNSLLPKMATEDQIRSVLDEGVFDTIPHGLTLLTKEFDSNYDKKVAVQIIKSMI